MERITLFADVLLPLPVKGTFTYRVPFELNDCIFEGIRVVVQFGARKMYTAIVVRVHEIPPEGRIPKYILSVLDENPIVNPIQLSLWDWMSEYYMCFRGEVMNAALPAALKLASESRIALNPGFREESSSLNEKEHLLVEALHNRKSLAISDVVRILGQQKVIPVIHTMIEHGVLVTEETLHNPYRPVKETIVRLSGAYSGNGDALKILFDRLERKAKKQLAILMAYIQLSQYGMGDLKTVRKPDLLKRSDATSSQLDALVRKQVFELEERLVNRYRDEIQVVAPGPVELSQAQQVALQQTRDAFQDKPVVLLHGVTSSGKTEIYINLIRDTLDQGKQVLYLLPEIALTSQIINRLRKYFGGRTGVYHSRFTDNERVDIWNQVLSGGAPGLPGGNRLDVVLGARSAIFLPFSNLGLVIVDEEHDPSFKQMDPAPRYHGRDSALMLARLHGAVTLLGSATPSVETYFNAQQGKYGKVMLSERFGNLEMPKVSVVNIREEVRAKQMKGHFSSVLLKQLESVLANQEQAILFQNRRGFSLRLECDTCHWMPTCVNCDVTLVYHKKINQLRCHYCGYTTSVPEVCPECRGTSIRMRGFGTEKVEEELGLIFPQARIARMDLDTARSKYAHQKIIADFEDRKIDILVGTQMVTKGLDFDNVSLVCILNADNMLSYPDFRAPERGFQLMAQVSGRSGRKYKQGKVLVQTYNPGHPIIGDVVRHDYLSMFEKQLTERNRFRYPPYFRLITIKLKHKDPELLNKAAETLAVNLRKTFGKRIMGPEFPVVSRIMNYYIKHILFKVEKDASMNRIKEKLAGITEDLRRDPAFKPVKIFMDVDPQ